MLNSLEQNARRAKEGSSFSDYKPGSATAEYRECCRRAEEIAAETKNRLLKTKAPADRAEKVDYLLSLYKRKKIAWLNDLYANRARVPSVLITGPANFPTRAKQKQNAREVALWAENPDTILDEIRAIGHNAKTIYSDDENAVERIKAKIEALKGAHDPYGNKSAEIRRLKGRLLELAPEEFAEQQANTTVNGAKTYEEIIALWDSGFIKKSEWNPGEAHYYFYLPLDFYDGKRHYKELLNFEVDETGANAEHYNFEARAVEWLPITPECKYAYITSKISGSGNKAVIYKHLKSLKPAAEINPPEEMTEAETESGAEETATINGEPAQVIRNKEAMRLQLVFDGKPDDKTREILKSNGFRWAPSCMAWQRLLNDNSEHALKRMTA